jgi:hypothetical protein
VAFIGQEVTRHCNDGMIFNKNIEEHNNIKDKYTALLQNLTKLG